MATRGSLKLDSSKQMSQAELAKIAGAIKAGGVKVVDWHILGQPAPDSVVGTLHVPAARTSAVVNKLIGLRTKGLRPRIEVFPVGIPAPDVFSIRFRF